MEITLLPYAYFEGRIVPVEEARVSIATHAVQYGTGVFGGIRGYLAADGTAINLFRADDHIRRLINSARLLKIGLPYDLDGLRGLLVELTRRNQPTSNVYYRPYAYKQGFSLTPNLSGLSDGFAVYMLPLNDFYSKSGGLSVMVSSWQRIVDNAIPARGKVSGGYINSSLAKDEATSNGYDDAIMLNERGKVTEGSASNLFIVREGTLITTPITSNILEGITRRSVIQIADDMGIPVEQRDIDRSELYLADEIFFCGTGVQVIWVAAIDRRPVGDGQSGPITTQLHERFFEIVQGRVPAYADWLTPVPLDTPVTTR